MLRTGQLLAPSQGRRCSASTTGSHPPPGAALPGTLASPRAGLTPAGCHELVARLRRPPPPFSLAPELLDARRVHKLGLHAAASYSWSRPPRRSRRFSRLWRPPLLVSSLYLVVCRLFA